MVVFWIGILIAAAFAYSTIKLGFYHAWTMLFNVVIAAYLGVHLGPAIGGFVPAAGGRYSSTLAVLAGGAGAFLILHGISYVFLIGQFEVTFPRGLNTLGSAVLGFAAGFLVWSFAVLVVCTTPFCKNEFVREIGFDSKTFEEAKMQSYLVWWCSLVDKVVVSGGSEEGTEQVVRGLLTKPAKCGTKGVTGKPGLEEMVDANEPNRPGVEQTPEPHTIIPP